jgi:hypothetical protein
VRRQYENDILGLQNQCAQPDSSERTTAAVTIAATAEEFDVEKAV